MRLAVGRPGPRTWFSAAVSLLLWLFFSFLLLLIVYRWASVPQNKGELDIPGLGGAVQVLRDRFAVPHIFAETESDAHLALGFVHAQDRLWQLEMGRSLVNGELALALGESALPFDRLVRTLGVAEAAESAWLALDAETQAQVSAYVRGLNVGIERARRRPWLQSPEFWLLNIRPQRWREQDVLLMSKMLGWEQSTNHSAELLRLAMIQRLDHVQVAQLFGLPEDLLKRTDLQFYRGLASKASSLLRDLPVNQADGLGSNQWLVDAAHSASARPMLANDPHLKLRAPASWYLAHLVAPGLDIIGATIPGLPVVMLGRAERLAWGLTNNGADVQDIYIERINPVNPAQYQTPDGWANFEVREEEIAVKGGPAVKLRIRRSRHGPIVSEALLPAAGALKAAKADGAYVFALAWTGLDKGDQSMAALMRLNRSRSSKELLASLSSYNSAPMNLLYADVEGRAGMQVIGAVPRRNPASELRGALPAPGWEPRHDWLGRIAARELPSLQVRDGILANANQRLAQDAPRDGSPATNRIDLGVDWTEPFRYDRVMQLLVAKPQHDVESFVAMQADVESLQMRALLPHLKKVQVEDPFAARLALQISQWDANMDATRAEPLIASAWLDELYRQLFGDELGDDLFDQFLAHRNRTGVLMKILTEARYSSWCDRIDTPAKETCEQILAQALLRASERLRQSFGDDPSRWRWGVAHEAVSEHLPFSRQALLAKLFEIRHASPGDANTVNAGATQPWHKAEPFANRNAASYRGVYDLADPDKSLFIQSTGQSGHVLSGNYRDLSVRWARSEYIPMITQRLEIERQSTARLTLRPAK